ncbi:SURF1 family cytochrome oxidase biogenesis protein [Nocardiopsis dassonvillei]|uniref:SURF1 family cytochrome oxidase biogenesis protein n=1 Tax=Nocardiopsis dassonvillei TaxID=2014 RepID=UPI00102BFE61|nr:SURF1 family protein [Nocardiopsis dassonvillei]
MLKVLFSQRMLAFHALVLVLVPSFVWLGFWQLDRAGQRGAAVDLQQSNLAADPVPVAELTRVGEDVAPDDRWRTVEATGTWDTGHELLLRNRDGSGGVGFHVLTPLVTEEGTAVLVNRGWVERGETALDQPEVPPAPEGTVEVAGRLHYSETEENTGLRNRDDLPEGQLMMVDVDQIAADLPYPVYGGYVDLTRQDPMPEAAPEPVVLHEEDAGMSASYAVQWWVFAVVAVGGWVFLVRREIQDVREAGAGESGETAEVAGAAETVESGATADAAEPSESAETTEAVESAEAVESGRSSPGSEGSGEDSGATAGTGRPGSA